jgi:hypothetical protein
MSEKKVIYQANVVSLPTLKMVLGEVSSPNNERIGYYQGGSEIKQPGIEMETAVTKLIKHLEKKK